MKIFLLTHERELLRASNTGALATSLAPEIVERVIWQRTTPSEVLLEAIRGERTVLLYPLDDDATEAAPITDFDNIILLDATWQEARKMFNKSPYLKNLPKAHFKTETVSQYQLRRNQPEGGLCTAECVIEILRARNYANIAEQLEEEFATFNSKIIN